jgi:hypothetical protein
MYMQKKYIKNVKGVKDLDKQYPNAPPPSSTHSKNKNKNKTI